MSNRFKDMGRTGPFPGLGTGWLGAVGRMIVFGMVGGANTLLDLAIYTMLVAGAGMAPLVANLFSFTAGGVSSFLLNRRFTFQATHRRISVDQVVRFALVTAICLGMSSLAIYLFLFVTTPVPAKIGSVGATFVTGYVLQRTFVFGGDLTLTAASPGGIGKGGGG